MKSTYRSVLISLAIFVISAISISYLYIFMQGYDELNLSKIAKVVSGVGLTSGVSFTLIFLLIHNMVNKIKNIVLLSGFLIVLFILLIFVVYWFFLTMLYFNAIESKSFLRALLNTLTGS